MSMALQHIECFAHPCLPGPGEHHVAIPQTRRWEWPAGWHHLQRGSMCPHLAPVSVLVSPLPSPHPLPNHFFLIDVFRSFGANCLAFPPATSASLGRDTGAAAEMSVRAAWASGSRGPTWEPGRRRKDASRVSPQTRTEACSSRAGITAGDCRSLRANSRLLYVSGARFSPPPGSKACAGGLWPPMSL